LNERSTLHPAIVSAAIAFFFLMLMLTGGQTAFMSLLLVSSFFILRFILEEKTGYRKLTATLVSVMIICMFLISARDHGMREDILNDSWDRLELWKSAFLANPDALFGVGTGDYKIILNEYYQAHGMERFAKDSYNSHNQFIQVYFSNGILGLITVIVLMCRPLYLSVKNDYSFGILVFFPFIIYGMTEVFLGRYQGIIFFALLHQLFIRYYGSVKPAFILKGS
jgi:O-antigen ligase